MRISDWSSDVCSSDLVDHPRLLSRGKDAKRGAGGNSRALFLAPVMTVRKRLCLGGDPPRGVLYQRDHVGDALGAVRRQLARQVYRTGVVEGKSVTGRLDIGGHRTLKTKQRHKHRT